MLRNHQGDKAAIATQRNKFQMKVHKDSLHKLHSPSVLVFVMSYVTVSSPPVLSNIVTLNLLPGGLTLLVSRIGKLPRIL